MNVWLGRCVSFNDNVSMGDVVRGFEQAIRDVLAAPGGEIPEFF